MKKKLIIKEHGLYVIIPGLAPFRTPATINITKIDEKIVTAALRRDGITNYEIKTSNDEIIQENKKEYIVSNNTTSLDEIKNTLTNLELMVKQLILNKQESDSTGKIESLLTNFLVSGKKNDQEENSKKSKKSKIDETVDDFIPEININKIQMKGKTTETVIKSNNNFLNNAEKLKDIKK